MFAIILLQRWSRRFPVDSQVKLLDPPDGSECNGAKAASTRITRGLCKIMEGDGIVEVCENLIMEIATRGHECCRRGSSINGIDYSPSEGVASGLTAT